MKVRLKVITFVLGLPESLLFPGKSVVLVLWECLGYGTQGKENQNSHLSQMRKAKL